MGENIVRKKLGKILSGTLSSGSTSLTFNDSCITTESFVDIYTDDYSITATDITVSAGKIVLTFSAQTKTVKVKLEVRNE